MFSVYFLGTGCMIPTEDRNHLSIALMYNGDSFLFDCGEGTQKELQKSPVHMSKIRKIFISHWHGDHVLGLSGLLQTLNNVQGVNKITIYGPQGTRQFMYHVLKSSICDIKYELCIEEITAPQKTVIVDSASYVVHAVNTDHGVPSLAYSFTEKDVVNLDKEKLQQDGIGSSPKLAELKMNGSVEYEGKKLLLKDYSYIKKGKKVSIILDSRLCDTMYQLAQGSDILITEATYILEEHAHLARKNMHMTLNDAVELARSTHAEQLILTHFSQRYKELYAVEQQAQDVFANLKFSFDGMKVELHK